MIGVAPHMMDAGDWTFVVGLQVGLLLLAALSVWLAAWATRPRAGR